MTKTTSESRIPHFPLQAYGSNVIVSRDDEKEFSDSGLIALPEPSRETPRMGTVISVGPGSYDAQGRFTPTRVKVNDRVLFGLYWGSDIDVDGQTVLIGHEEGIHGTVPDDDRRMERLWSPRTMTESELTEAVQMMLRDAEGSAPFDSTTESLNGTVLSIPMEQQLSDRWG